jgi:hypothetical protein
MSRSKCLLRRDRSQRDRGAPGTSRKSLLNGQHHRCRMRQGTRGARDRNRVIAFWRATATSSVTASTTRRLKDQASEQEPAGNEAQWASPFPPPRAETDSSQCRAKDRKPHGIDQPRMADRRRQCCCRSRRCDHNCGRNWTARRRSHPGGIKRARRYVRR